MAKGKRSKSSETPKGDRTDRPFPSSPKHPPKHVIYLESDNGKRYIETFVAIWAAKKFYEAVVGEEEIKWLSKNEIAFDKYRMKAETLEDIVEYEYGTAREEEWVLPEPLPSQIARFKGERVAKERDTSPAPVKEMKVRKPRESREGLISIQAIAEELKILPRDARAILRKGKIDKPASGWAWSEKDAAPIRELLKKGKK